MFQTAETASNSAGGTLAFVAAALRLEICVGTHRRAALGGTIPEMIKRGK